MTDPSPVASSAETHPSFAQRLTHSPMPEFAIVLLAAGVRLWRLIWHSIWFDEAVSIRWARADAAWIWDQTFPLQQDKHPPGYYLYLHLWNNVLEWLGQDHSDWLLRASGVLPGVLTVVGLLLVVRIVSGRKVALLAAALAALAPALVWYSQELRMFQPAATLGVWAAFFVVAAWRSPRLPVRLLLWLGLTLTLAAGAYVYLFSAFLFPAAGLSALALLLIERDRGQMQWRRLAESLLALAMGTLLFLPLARNAWLVNDAESTPGAPFAHFADALWTQVRVFTIWRPGWQEGIETLILALAALLIVLGLVLRGRNRGTVERPLLWIWLFTPLLVGGLLQATTDSVFGEDRYFLFLAPVALWALARGVMLLAESKKRLWRAVGMAAGAAMVTALVMALPPLWTPNHARENWRAAVASIVAEHRAAPNLRTAVISHIDYTHLPAEWYLRQQYTFDDLPLYYPFGGALAPDQIDDVIAPPLAGVEEAGFDTLWLLQSHLEGMDDGHLVEGWLAERYPLLAEQFPAGIRQTAYAIRSHYDALPESLPDEARIDAEVAPGVRLAACEVTTPEVAARDDLLHPPSGRVHVRMWWNVDATPAEDFRPQVRVANDAGVWGEALEREGDAMRIFPTSTWTPGAYIRHEVDVHLNPDTPDGEYLVTVALLDEAGAAVTEPVVCGNVVAGSQKSEDSRR